MLSLKDLASRVKQFFQPFIQRGTVGASGTNNPQVQQNTNNFRQFTNNAVNQVRSNWNMPNDQRINVYRNALANQLNNTPSVPQWFNNAQTFTRNLPNIVENRYQQGIQNVPAPFRPLLTPSHLIGKVLSNTPNTALNLLGGTPKVQANIEQVKKFGTVQEKARLQNKLIADQASNFAFGATNAPIQKGLTKELALDIFKLKPNATEAEIVTAYKTLIKKEAPRSILDLANNSKANAQKIINNAKELLLKESKLGKVTPLLSDGGIPLRDNGLPKRSELSGAQLNQTNDKLLHPEKIVPNEDYGLAQQDFQINKPTEVKVNNAQQVNDHNFIEDMKKEVRNPDGVFNNIPVKLKVNVVDYFRTPDRVLEKIGLGKEAKQLRYSWDKYQTELPKEIQKVTEWSKRIMRPEGNQIIFRYLDGQIPSSQLNQEEIKVATEIKSYLSDWARKLGLPPEKRITSYITHIWANDVKGQEFPDEIASLIRDKVAGSVYDPFVTKRLGKQGYLEDTWKSLDAYVKRATRKYNMDSVLNQVKQKSETFEDSQFKYVKNYIDRINMRPTEIDNLVDNWIKTTPIGYKLTGRPTANVTRTLRRAVYRGLLGLNPASAIRNLSQSSNTYAELGERYFVSGAIKTLRELPNYVRGKETELEKVGVLQDGFVEDRVLSATKQAVQKMDEGLFYMFNLAEKINRSISYFGAKSKALNQGMSYADAVEYGKEITRKTQFTFGKIDTTPLLESDILKSLFQFQSYGFKQVEFLGEKVSRKEWVGLIRYIASMMLFVTTIGKLFGMKWTDIIPSFRFGVPPTLQVAQGAYEVATKSPDKWGNQPDPNLLKRAFENYNLTRGLTSYVPAGNQLLNKTTPALVDYARGESKTPSGGMRYPIDKNPSNLIKGALFGPKAMNEAQKYYSNETNPLSKKQADTVRNSTDKNKTYQDLMDKREQNAIDEKIKQFVEKTGTSQNVENKFYYVDKKGVTQMVDLNFQPTKPEYTGMPSVDKKLRSKFNGEITSKSNDIMELLDQNQITAKDAEKQLNDLANLKAGTGTKSARAIKIKKSPTTKIAFKIKKTSFPKIKIVAPPKFIAKTKKVKNIYTASKPLKIAKAKSLKDLKIKWS